MREGFAKAKTNSRDQNKGETGGPWIPGT